MARARQLKPAFFLDEDVGGLGFATRLLFQGLWTLADRKGRLPDRPAWIRAQVFPYDDLEGGGLSVGAMLDELARPRRHRPGGFIVRYVVDGRAYVQVRNFERHQHPHPKEVESELPPPPSDTEKPRPSRGKQRLSKAAAEPWSSRGKAAAEPLTNRAVPSVPSVPSSSNPPTPPAPQGGASRNGSDPATATLRAERLEAKRRIEDLVEQARVFAISLGRHPTREHLRTIRGWFRAGHTLARVQEGIEAGDHLPKARL